MVVAQLRHGRPHFLDRIRERVRLAAGLDEKRNLKPEARERALACLERFGERIRELPPEHVRAVGTNTLRRTRDKEFLVEATAALGHPIEVISGEEEARLVYLGVSHTLAEKDTRRLVVDIGGGSTECIVGERFKPLLAHSFSMGCVTYSMRFFKEGRITEKRFKQAEIAARQELLPIQRRFKELEWAEAVGSSGTIRAIESVLRENQWSEHGIDQRGIAKLRRALLACSHVEELELPGLSADRRPVLPGGLAVLYGVFHTFGVETMDASRGALREGLIYDLLGRIRHEDVRDMTVRSLAVRFNVDTEQAARVGTTARELCRAVEDDWGLTHEDAQHMLEWAALLHELGLSLAFTGYHKIGGFLVENADMPGFSMQDKLVLAGLVRSHRKKLDLTAFDRLPEPLRDLAKKLSVLIRLAANLHRSRRDADAPRARSSPDDWRKLHLEFPDGFLGGHPLIQADLDQEAQGLARLGFELTFG